MYYFKKGFYKVPFGKYYSYKFRLDIIIPESGIANLGFILIFCENVLLIIINFRLFCEKTRLEIILIGTCLATSHVLGITIIRFGNAAVLVRYNKHWSFTLHFIELIWFGPSCVH